jgi:hypothetical protein
MACAAIEPLPAATLLGKQICDQTPVFISRFVARHRVLHDTTYNAHVQALAQYLARTEVGIRQTEPRAESAFQILGIRPGSRGRPL